VIKPFHINDLWFSPSPLVFWLSLIGLLGVLALSITASLRASRPKTTIPLEVLRVIIACLIVFILWEPEIRKITPPAENPEIAILYDASPSMETLDSRKGDLIENDTDIITREEWVKLALDDKNWNKLEKDGKTKYYIQEFSKHTSNLTEQQKAVTGTNYTKQLSEMLKAKNNLRAVIMLGDGAHNEGESPTKMAQLARSKQVPIYTIPVGSETYLPDLNLLSVDAPEYGIVGETVQIRFTIRSTLPRLTKTSIKIKDTKTQRTVTKNIAIPANAKSYQDSILWTIKGEETMAMELTLPYQNIELLDNNNSQSFTMDARKENIKVLVIETLPRWEYRFIRNALSRDPGVELDCLLLHPDLGIGDGPDYIKAFPEKIEDLQKYDVIFLGDIGIGENQLTTKQADLLHGLVTQQASGIVFIPGSEGNIFSLLKQNPKTQEAYTKLGELIPVELDETIKEGTAEITPSALQLTEKGKGSHLTMLGESEEQNARIWQKLPGFSWYAPVLKPKAGTDVLAVHSNKRTKLTRQRMPMLVTSTAGNGKVLFLAHDSAWRWRKGVEDLYHYRFWGQVARWMSYKRNRAAGDNLRLFFNVERPKPGSLLTLKASAFDNNGSPIRKGNVIVDIKDPSGNIQSINLIKEDGDWGGYNGSYKVNLPGEHKVTCYTSLNPNKKVETAFIAPSSLLEKVGEPMRINTLREISAITLGKTISTSEISQLADMINALPEREPEILRTKVWNHPWLMWSVIILLALFWTGRKFNGTF